MAAKSPPIGNTIKSRVYWYVKCNKVTDRKIVARECGTNPGYVGRILKEFDLKKQVAENSSVGLTVPTLAPPAIAPTPAPKNVSGNGYPMFGQTLLEPDAQNKIQHRANSQDSEVRYMAACDSATPPYLLEQLSFDESPKVKAGVAANPNTPKKTLGWLAAHYSKEIITSDYTRDILRKVAAHHNTPQETLHKLSYYQNRRVLRKVAANTNTPQRTLDRLAKSQDPKILLAVAENISTSQKTLIELFHSGRYETTPRGYITEAILNNPCLDAKQLNRMLRTSGSLHTYYADLKRKTDLSPDLLAENAKYWRLHVDIAANTNTPQENLRKLSQKDKYGYHFHTRRAVAANPYTPQDALTVLSSDEHDKVRHAVAGNPSSPQVALNTLASDRVYWIRLKVAQNPSTSKETLIALTSDRVHDVRRAARLALLAFGVHPSSVKA